MKSIIFLFLIISNLVFPQSAEFTLFNIGISGTQRSIAEDTSGNIWVAITSYSAPQFASEIILLDEEVIDTIIIPTGYPIYGLDVDQQNNLWIATQDTGLIKYDGLSLEYFDISQIITRTPRHNNANCVQVDNENNIWIGAVGGLAKYDGNVWTVYDDLNSPLQIHPDIWSIKFDNQNNLWFGGYYGAGRFDGNNWTLWSIPPFQYLYTVSISKNGSVWFGPYWGTYIELIDDSTWNTFYSILALPNSSYQIAVDNNNIKWLGQFASDEQILAYNGLYFTNLAIPFPELAMSSLKSIYADKQNNKWFGFDGGYIVKYTGDFPTNVNEGNENIPLQFSLSQNYPNPFNPSTTIKYSIPSVISNGERNLNVAMKIYDVLGKEIATLVNEEKPAGSYEVEFQSTIGNRQLASGIYFYVLKAGSFIQIKKMILIK